MRVFALTVLTGLFCSLNLDGRNLPLGRFMLEPVAAKGVPDLESPAPASGGPGTPTRPPSDYLTAPVERGSVEETIAATGALRPVETVEIGSPIAGEVSRLFVDFNDEVRVGQPLAQLDPRTFVARLDQQRAALAAARATVEVQRVRLDRARIDLETARGGAGVLSARVDSAAALAAAASETFARQKALQASNIVSQSAFDAARADRVAKAASLREASTTLDLHGLTVAGAEADLRRMEAELAQAQADVPLREAELRVAEIELDRTMIRSPIDGVVVGRFVNQGQTLAEGVEARTIFTVARDLARMEIHAKVDETDIGRLKPGQRASFGVDAYPGRRFSAVVRQIRKAAEVNQNVVTYTVVLTTDNKDGSLLPGMTAVAKIVTQHADDVLKVPLAALRFDPAGRSASPPTAFGRMPPAVWVVERSGRISRVPVATGTESDDQVALTAGRLAEADRVIVGEAVKPQEQKFLGIRMSF